MNKTLRRDVSIISNIIRRIFIPPFFYFIRFLKDQYFLLYLNHKVLKPVIGFKTIALVWRGFNFTVRIFSNAFTEYSLEKYQSYIRFHYSKQGRGYFDYSSLSDLEKTGLYGEPTGRIKFFIEKFPHILKFENGDSFLDVGCGRGQNIKILLDQYSGSHIRGFDISADAIDVIQKAVNNQNLEIDIRDITNMKEYELIGDNQYDHIIMSHVFSFITKNNIVETKKLRQSILEELVRISKKTVLIIDGSYNFDLKEKFVIEQKHRGHFKESIINYFDQMDGSVVIATSPNSIGIIFKHSPN